MEVVVVIPTYNEADNIRQLIAILAEEFVQIPHNCRALVVDDSSPDGTYRIVEELRSQYPFLHLLVRKEKTGIGGAYFAGFKQAMAMGADVVIEMDADFQHDPRDVKRLVQAIDEGYDYAVGSRFVAGGKIPKEWAFYRKFLSFGGSLFSKIVLGMPKHNDFTSGFKASRVKGFVDQINFDGVLSKGFAYKIDLLYRMHKLGAKFKEVPISFGLRDRGDSKMGKDNMFDCLKVVLRLRYNDSKHFVKFLAVGLAGFFVDFVLANGFRLSILQSAQASLLAGFIAMLTTYTLNNFWSFRDRQQIVGVANRIKSIVIYVVSSYLPILFRSWLIRTSTLAFGDNVLIFNVTFLLGVVIGLIWNFTVYSKIIWKK